MKYLYASLLLAASLVSVNAHIAAWTRGMYCMFGTPERPDPRNNNIPVAPLYNLSFKDWWFQGHRGCDRAPPPEGEFLDLPAGGSFQVQLAGNLAFTNYSWHPAPAAIFGDGVNHTLPYVGENGGCITSPNLHAQSETDAAGSAFAISYNSNLSDVTMDNLVVFSVRKNTPYLKLADFDVPKDLPPCPEGGCHCAWLWIAKGCGQENMYMHGSRCMVSNSTSTRVVAKAQTPIYCANEPEKCLKGAKSMIVYQQAEGNNVPGAGPSMRPLYNEVMGFYDGAQNDIYEDSNLSETAVGNVTDATSPELKARNGEKKDRRFLLLQSKPAAE